MRILHPVSLDARLSLVYDLVDPCELAADIGTDHARLPAALLQRGRCCRMILTDISPDALENARREIIRCGLSGKADLRLGDGLSPLSESCGVVSITGMGGQTMGETMGFGNPARLAAGFSPTQLHAEKVNGYDPLAVIEATTRKKELLLKGEGPALLEVAT